MFNSEQIVGVVNWLEKYRRKILWIILVPVVFIIAVFWKADLLITLVTQPLKGLPLHFMTPVDGFMAKMKIAFYGGIVLSLPVVAYLIVSLVAGRLAKKTRMLIYFLVIPFAILSFSGGMFFGYRLILPATIKFLLDCGNQFMEPMIMGSNYFSFIAFILLTIGIVFELPLILVVLSRIGIVSSRFLRDKQKIAIIAIITILAIITPTPDAITLSLISLPMIVLYEISIWWIYFLEKARKRQEENNLR